MVAEIMLRQTKASQVSQVYPAFVQQYPDLQSLARADHEKVQQLVGPLGIRSRASNLLEIAKKVERQHGGRIPDSFTKLVGFPGVGPYIANSVLVRAFGENRPLVDLNVSRVIARISEGTDRVARKTADCIFMSLATHAKSGVLNYALIDLAHIVCNQTNPKCLICPIKDLCIHAKLCRQ